MEVSLDYLVGEGINSKLDKQALKRLHDLERLDEDKKKTLYDLIDTYIRDAKAEKLTHKRTSRLAGSFVI